jgi:acyl-coenzyme A synthetase/AMP-(fatty) acid ligase
VDTILQPAASPAVAPNLADYHEARTSFSWDQARQTELSGLPTEDMALLHFTSGTTGKPKGAIHVHAAVLAHHVTGKLALDLHPDDVFWCTADPGWVTGTSYGIISPLSNGVTSIVDEATSTPSAGTGSSRSSGSRSGTPPRPRSGC